jgi:hypothetical protein
MHCHRRHDEWFPTQAASSVDRMSLKKNDEQREKILFCLWQLTLATRCAEKTAAAKTGTAFKFKKRLTTLPHHATSTPPCLGLVKQVTKGTVTLSAKKCAPPLVPDHQDSRSCKHSNQWLFPQTTGTLFQNLLLMFNQGEDYKKRTYSSSGSSKLNLESIDSVSVQEWAMMCLSVCFTKSKSERIQHLWQTLYSLHRDPVTLTQNIKQSVQDQSIHAQLFCRNTDLKKLH